MNTLDILFYSLMIVWFWSEILYKIKMTSDKTDQKDKDRSSLKILWITIMLSITLANMLKAISYFPISNLAAIYYIGLSLIAISIGLRYFINS